MREYGHADLLHDCANSKQYRIPCPGHERGKALMESWKALNAWILSRFEIGRGVVILNFGKISWESNTDIKNVVMRRPTFLISESFSKTHGLPFKRKLKALSLAPMEDINFTKLAIKYSNSMTKDVVFCAVRDIIARLGIVIGAGKMVNIQMSIGRLIAKDRVVTMEFDPNCFPKTVKVPASMVAELEQRNVDNEKVTLNQEEQGSVDKAKVVIRIPTMGTVDVDEERSTHERLDEERSTDERLNEERSTHKRLNEEKSTHEKLEENREESNVGSEVILPKSDQDTVLEDAYRRHLEEVDREIHRDQMDVAQVWDKHRQDCLSVAHEKRNFRTKAEQAQQLIRCQIQDRELARKKNAALTNATLGPCNILPGSPRYPEPVDDTFGSDRRISHLRRQQSELQRQLDMQVDDPFFIGSF